MISVQAKLKSFFCGLVFILFALLRANQNRPCCFIRPIWAAVLSLFLCVACVHFPSLLLLLFCIALYTHTRLALYWNKLVPT